MVTLNARLQLLRTGQRQQEALVDLFTALADKASDISRIISAGDGLGNTSGAQNADGDTQKALDVLADGEFLEAATAAIEGINPHSSGGGHRLAREAGAALINNRFDNKFEGEAYGAELSTHWDVLPWWKLSGSYSYIQLDLSAAGNSTDTTTEESTEEATD